MSDDGIPDDLRPWVEDRKAELARIHETDPDLAERLRVHYEDQLTAMLEPYQGQQINLDLSAEPTAILRAHMTPHEPRLTLTIDDSKVTVIRAT